MIQRNPDLPNEPVLPDGDAIITTGDRARIQEQLSVLVCGEAINDGPPVSGNARQRRQSRRAWRRFSASVERDMDARQRYRDERMETDRRLLAGAINAQLKAQHGDPAPTVGWAP